MRKWEDELFTSEITGSVLAYPAPHKNKYHAYFYHFPAFEYHGIYYTNTISNQSTVSQQGLSHVTNDIQEFAKMLHQTLGTPRSLTWQHAVWWTTTYSVSHIMLNQAKGEAKVMLDTPD